MGKTQKLSVKGDLRKKTRAVKGKTLPRFSPTQTIFHELPVANKKEIVGLIGYMNNEVLPLVQRLSTELQRISTDVEVLRNRQEVLQQDVDRQVTENAPKFELYPMDSDDEDSREY